MLNSSITAYLLLLIFLFNSCDVRETNISAKKQPPFKLTISDPVEDLDPIKIIYSSDMLAASFIYEGLVRMGETFEQIEPSIAKSWSYSSNKRELTFFLNDEIYFQDDPCFPNGKGRKLNSKDISYTFERIAGNSSDCINFSMIDNKIVGLEDFQNGNRNSINGIEIIDSLTIKIKLTQAFVSFLKILSSPVAYIVPKEAVEFYGEEFSQNPVGTGPFKLTLWDKFKEIILTKNEKYSKRISSGNNFPLLEQINIIVLPNPGLGLTEFLKGKSNLITVEPTIFDEIKKENNFENKFEFRKVEYGSSVRFFGFSMDKNTKLAANKFLRQRLNSKFHSNFTERDEGKNFREAHSLFPQHGLTSEDQNYLIDDEELDFYGEQVQLFTSMETNDSRILAEILEKSQNIEFIFTVEPARYYRLILENRPDIFRVSVQPSYPDPEEYYSLFYSKSGKEVNLCAYSNEIYDKIFEESLTEFDPILRDKLFQKMEDILSEDVPAIWSSHENSRFIIFQKNIKEIKFSNMLPDLRFAYFQ